MSEARPGPEDPARQRGILEQLSATLETFSGLLSTRLEIFGEEASAKLVHLARGLGAFALALVTGWISMLLLAALLVALFTLLFGRLWAGVLAALVVYGATAAASVFLGWKAMSRVRPLDFPATGAELRKDWDALSTGLSEDEAAGPGTGSGAPLVSRTGPRPHFSVDDVEARYRERAE